MENQHRKITGYRELNEEEIALMNEIKALGAALGKLHASIETRVNDQYQALGGLDAPDSDDLDAAWSAIEAAQEAKRNLQTGVMWLTRAVAQPKGF